MEMQWYELQTPIPMSGMPLLLTDDLPDAPTTKGTALIIGGEDDEVSRPQRTDDPPDEPGPKGTALPIWGDD